MRSLCTRPNETPTHNFRAEQNIELPSLEFIMIRRTEEGHKIWNSQGFITVYETQNVVGSVAPPVSDIR